MLAHPFPPEGKGFSACCERGEGAMTRQGANAHREGKAEEVGGRQAGRAKEPEQARHSDQARPPELRQVEAAEAGDDACARMPLLGTPCTHSSKQCSLLRPAKYVQI